MSSVAIEGNKWVECERGVGGRTPHRYIPEQDPVQDALMKDKSHLFQADSPHTSELRWYGSGLEQFLHVAPTIHMQADGA
eukprot:CCRYP_019190-RA/>CCRYP_019190-RA protein AED:0.43 eAED:0.43 QI:0/-1/0/1/-1/1/1/0/79